MSNGAKMSALAAAALVLCSLSLDGCAISTIGSSPMDARAEVPARPNAGGYLAVEDLPPKGEKPTTMTVDERLKLQKELIDARDRQASRAKAKEGTASPQATKP
jgi:hypothetical protein